MVQLRLGSGFPLESVRVLNLLDLKPRAAPPRFLEAN